MITKRNSSKVLWTFKPDSTNSDKRIVKMHLHCNELDKVANSKFLLVVAERK